MRRRLACPVEPSFVIQPPVRRIMVRPIQLDASSDVPASFASSRLTMAPGDSAHRLLPDSVASVPDSAR
jgi:hypothetical protein